MKHKLKVLIVDDHAMMRLGLADAIAAERDLALAGSAANAADAVELFAKLEPDVVTMDFHLPGLDGAEGINQLRSAYPQARVVVFSVSEAEEDIWQAVRAGAMAYVPKSAEVEEVLEAVRRAFRGETHFPGAIAEKLAARERRESLTPRELEVLRLIVAGCCNKEIVSTLQISDATVKLHISNMLAKLQVADRTQAAIAAVQRGIVHLDG
jgi:DNA-binding NarL/FixJ family response regulator